MVTISGMFGEVDGQIHTYFADSPVVIDIDGLEWPESSPFNVIRIDVLYGNVVVGSFHADTGGQSSMSFNIESALHAIWGGYTFADEIAAANLAAGINATQPSAATRAMREYSLRVYTEYLSSDDGGVFTTTDCGLFTGGQCLIGGLTEWERSVIARKEDADVSSLEHTGVRNGDASTKPVSSPERVGKKSITSWVDVQAGLTKTIFYPSLYNNGEGQADDSIYSDNGWTGHAPLVLRDSMAYTDFLFVNRRGAVETCSAPALESMNIDIETKQYGRVERPTFQPSRTLMTLTQSGPRRSWAMSSGLQTREWAEWWATEFLTARRVWMWYKPSPTQNGAFVPVTVTPAKNSIDIYDRSKQNMMHVDFTVTLALEG